MPASYIGFTLKPDGFFEGNIMVFVNDTAHLEKLIQRLSKVNGVLLVERFD